MLTQLGGLSVAEAAARTGASESDIKVQVQRGLKRPAGLMAGSVGAFGYALSCPEASPAFVAVWYTLGVALTGAVGAVLGPRVLRW